MRGPFASSSVSSSRGTGHTLRANRVLARSHMLRAVFLCLFALIPPRGAGASSMITDQTRRPGESSQSWYGFEIGSTFSLPLPSASANRDEIGLDAGLSCTVKVSPSAGIGANIAYHYWPVSSEQKQKFNDFIRERTLNTLKLGGGTWGLSVLQVGGHIRVAAPTTRNVRPWLQVGASSYRVDPNTSGYSGDAGFFTVIAPPLKPTQHLGYSIAAGTDLFGRGPARVGLDATYHFVSCRDRYGEDLRVLTLGAHALLSW